MDPNCHGDSGVEESCYVHCHCHGLAIPVWQLAWSETWRCVEWLATAVSWMLSPLNGLLRKLHQCHLFLGGISLSFHSFFIAVGILMFPEFRGCILPVTEVRGNKTTFGFGIGILAFLCCDHASEIFCLKNKYWKRQWREVTTFYMLINRQWRVVTTLALHACKTAIAWSHHPLYSGMKSPPCTC